MKLKLISLFLISIIFAGCKTVNNELTYFNNIPEASGTIGDTDYNIKINPDDELRIVVSSLIPEATAIYNMPLTNIGMRTTISTQTQPQQLTYIVSKDGNITMPIIGKVHVEGLTIQQITDLLTEKISKDVDNPNVNVSLTNFKVNVLGEVKKPGTINIERERFSILDAISEAGDLTEYGLRNNILLIREENGKKAYYRINLNDADLLNSPHYYLQQNDVIYVEPNKIKKDNSKYNQNNAFKVTVVSTIVSALSVIASLVIALAVK